jgi:LysR family transcriptional regulator, glycine cleavage system transcriptional activator
MQFQDTYPAATLSIYPAEEQATFDQSRFDAAIIFGRPSWPEADVLALGQLETFPVCSPKLLASLASPLRPKDLINQVLIDGIGTPHWHDWFALYNVPYPKKARHVHFQDFNHNLAAARAGVGFAMGDSITVQEDLESGGLVRPFKKAVLQNTLSYYLVTPTSETRSSLCNAFVDWLTDATRAARI